MSNTMVRFQFTADVPTWVAGQFPVDGTRSVNLNSLSDEALMLLAASLASTNKSYVELWGNSLSVNGKTVDEWIAAVKKIMRSRQIAEVKAEIARAQAIDDSLKTNEERRAEARAAAANAAARLAALEAEGK